MEDGLAVSFGIGVGVGVVPLLWLMVTLTLFPFPRSTTSTVEVRAAPVFLSALMVTVVPDTEAVNQFALLCAIICAPGLLIAPIVNVFVPPDAGKVSWLTDAVKG